MSLVTKSIIAQNISKVFTTGKTNFTAVKDLSFEIFSGESVAFLGPNGAGKSTTIKVLCGIIEPTSGSAKINNQPAGSHEANKNLGLVFGTRSQLFMHMTVSQCLSLIAEIYYLTGKAKIKRIGELSEHFEITKLLPCRVRTLSLGQRMRCEVVAALLHRPKILLADEPTIGLDIVAKNKLRELILRWQTEEQSTLLLTSHDLSDVEALCDRCILIDKGIKCFDGKLADLRGDLVNLRRIQITVSDQATPKMIDNSLIQSIIGEDFIHNYEMQTTRIPMSETLALLSAHYGDSLQDIQISTVSLEEVLAYRYRDGR